jgi:hypothetical protein
MVQMLRVPRHKLHVGGAPAFGRTRTQPLSVSGLIPGSFSKGSWVVRIIKLDW